MEILSTDDEAEKSDTSHNSRNSDKIHLSLPENSNNCGSCRSGYKNNKSLRYKKNQSYKHRIKTSKKKLSEMNFKHSYSFEQSNFSNCYTPQLVSPEFPSAK